MDSLELLSIIDIIKNEELYAKKLQEIKTAEQRLANAKYIDMTVEKADSLRESAAKEFDKAKELVEQAKKNAVEQDKQFAARMDETNQKVVQAQNEANKKVLTMREKMKAVYDLEAKMKDWDGKLSEWSQRLTEQEKQLVQRERTLTHRVEAINKIMKEEANG